MPQTANPALSAAGAMDLFSYAAANRAVLLAFCLSLAKDTGEAEDLLHHTLLAAHRALDRRAPLANPHGYLIASLRANHYYRCNTLRATRSRHLAAQHAAATWQASQPEEATNAGDSSEALLLAVENFVVAKFGVTEAGYWQLYHLPQPDGIRLTLQEVATIQGTCYSFARRRVKEIQAAIIKHFGERYQALTAAQV